MSNPGNSVKTLEQTIVADLKGAVNWLEGEAVTVGAELWDVVKSVFLTLTKDQAQIAMNVLNRIETSVLAGKSIEEIETAALMEAVAEEQAELLKMGSTAFQAVIAIFKHSNVPSAK